MNNLLITVLPGYLYIILLKNMCQATRIYNDPAENLPVAVPDLGMGLI
jgi:hypothetical protein